MILRIFVFSSTSQSERAAGATTRHPANHVTQSHVVVFLAREKNNVAGLRPVRCH